MTPPRFSYSALPLPSVMICGLDPLSLSILSAPSTAYVQNRTSPHRLCSCHLVQACALTRTVTAVPQLICFCPCDPHPLLHQQQPGGPFRKQDRPCQKFLSLRAEAGALMGAHEGLRHSHPGGLSDPTVHEPALHGSAPAAWCLLYSCSTLGPCSSSPEGAHLTCFQVFAQPSGSQVPY